MKSKRVLACCVAACGVATVFLLGGANSSGKQADEPVRVYLVHGGVAPFQGRSSTGYSHGITIYSTAGQGNVWPTQVIGYLDDVDEHWVVLKQVSEQRKDLEVWIPRERVQVIEYLDDENFKVLVAR